MNISLITSIVIVCAAIPTVLFLVNCVVYTRLPDTRCKACPVSVLIPARNEADNIRATLESVLANASCELEVVVLDDHSTDMTAEIVASVAQRDPRVRLVEAPPLPPGWCGKQHACQVLSQWARYPLLLFLDADVRIQSNALTRLASFMENRGVALASGVPHQELGTFSERLLIPLIHFILLGFLPLPAMRRTRLPAMSGGCGQLFLIRKEAYSVVGGHSRIRDSMHDGIKLPRLFRECGYRTDLFDATDVATCRMYRTNGETWRGLGKNAIEGLAAPRTIVPMTFLLLVGQVMPWVLLGREVSLLSLSAVVLSVLPRLIGSLKFRQPWWSAFAHPVAIVALLVIQWQALFRSLRGVPSEWKGRRYDASSRLQPATR